MAANHISPGAVGIEDFVPEQWSDSIIALYDAKTAMKDLVNIVPHRAGAGDVINIPVEGPGGSPNRKVFETDVIKQNHNSSMVRLSVDEHWEYSYLLEDKENSQAMASLQPMLSKAAGRNMARMCDATIMAKAAIGFQTGGALTSTPTPYGPNWGAGFAANLLADGAPVIGSDGNTLYTGGNAASLTDAAILDLILRLENEDVDTDDLVFVLPPSAKRDVLEIDKHVLADNLGSDENIRGQFGSLYGVPVVLTNACPKLDNGAGGLDRVGFLMSREAVYMAYQWDIRSQVDYVQRELGHLFTFDSLYGVEVARPTAGVAIVVPNQ